MPAEQAKVPEPVDQTGHERVTGTLLADVTTAAHASEMTGGRGAPTRTGGAVGRGILRGRRRRREDKARPSFERLWSDVTAAMPMP